MFRRILLLLQEHFNATPKEARGYVVLISLSFFILLLPSFFRFFVKPLVYDPGVVISGTAINLTELTDATEVTEKQSDADEPVEVPVSLFAFDPNVVTIDEMVSLGFPLFLAKRVNNYRSKGGQFRKKEDLLKIYDFPVALYNSLERYINMQAPSYKAEPPVVVNEAVSVSSSNGISKPRNQDRVKFDLNTSDSLQLVGLRGIGPVLSLRILRYRSALGGFHSMNQLYEVYKLDSTVVEEIIGNSYIQKEVTKIEINHCTSADLLKHPYLRGKSKEVGILMNYRLNNGPLLTSGDLMKSKSVDSTTIMKMLPYLKF